MPNISECFFAKHVWVVTASAKYHFVCWVDLNRKMLPLTLVMLWLFLNIFRANTVNHLWTTDLLLIKQVICPKCCWRSAKVAQQPSLKLCPIKLHKFYKKASVMESLFCKAVCPTPTTVLKRMPSLTFFSEYTYLNVFAPCCISIKPSLYDWSLLVSEQINICSTAQVILIHRML